MRVSPRIPRRSASRLRTCKTALVTIAAGLLSACLGIPEGVQPVADFDAERYLGRWYEIARLDHSFERNLVNVTAEYSRRDDGAVRVLNRGFDTQDNEWSEIEGVARFVGDESEAHLKVSFFGPFYGSYVVFELGREDTADGSLNGSLNGHPGGLVEGSGEVSGESSREGAHKGYAYAFVSGFNRDYLWLLARTPEVPDALRVKFTERAASLGFATDDLIWVEHPPR